MHKAKGKKGKKRFVTLCAGYRFDMHDTPGSLLERDGKGHMTLVCVSLCVLCVCTRRTCVCVGIY